MAEQEQFEGAAPGPPDPEPQSTPFLVLQFFVFPLAIVVVSVAVFVVFGMVASEGKGPLEYAQEIRSGSANRRWQAAFELSRVIQTGDPDALQDERFVAEMVSLFDASADDDPRVRRYLALALGRLKDARAVPSLSAALQTANPGEPDPETAIFAIWALGSIGDAAALPSLTGLAVHPDAGIRKTLAHALGSFDTDEARTALAGLLADAVPDVRWNAAVALGRGGDARAVPVLRQMLDAGVMTSVDGLTADQREAAVVQAVAAASRLQDPDLTADLERLRDHDSSLRVRDAARAALAGAASVSNPTPPPS